MLRNLPNELDFQGHFEFTAFKAPNLHHSELNPNIISELKSKAEHHSELKPDIFRNLSRTSFGTKAEHHSRN